MLVGVLVAGVAACASTRSNAAGAGAVGYRAADQQEAATTARGGAATTTGRYIGGTPAGRTHLHSGATPAVSPVINVRGNTWYKVRPKPSRAIQLAPGGYEAETIVTAGLDAKAKQPYVCTVSMALVTTTGTTLLETPALQPGETATTFVVGSQVTAAAIGTGSVGCSWTVVLVPA
jgi:hypothetical protein